MTNTAEAIAQSAISPMEPTFGPNRITAGETVRSMTAEAFTGLPKDVKPHISAGTRSIAMDEKSAGL